MNDSYVKNNHFIPLLWAGDGHQREKRLRKDNENS